MNGQIKHIVHAFLLLLLLPLGFFSLKLTFQTDSKENDSKVIDYINPQELLPPSPVFTKGQSLFRSNCASCHVLFMNMTGPDLIGFEDREPWTDRKNVYEWIKNPSAFIVKNKFARELRSRYNITMTAFPALTNEEIDAICEYIKQAEEFRSPESIVKR